MIFPINDKTEIIPSKRRFYFRAKIKDWKNLNSILRKQINSIFKLGYELANPQLDYMDLPINSNEGIPEYELPAKIRNYEFTTLFASTLGEKIDFKIKDFLDKKQIANATLLDAWASESIEALNDFFTKIIKQKATEISFRFSPGYGEFDIRNNYLLNEKYLKSTIVNIDKKTGLILPRKSTICLNSWNSKRNNE